MRIILLAGLALLLLLGLVSRAAAADDQELRGIPLDVAQDRSARIKDLTYDLRFEIPVDRAEPVAGRATIRFTLEQPERPLHLDFAGVAVSRLVVNGRSLNATPSGGWLPLDPAALKGGANDVEVEFTAADVALNRDPEFLYTLFVPARAHTAFPCFDQPDLKARFTLALDVPDGWETLANGRERSRTNTGGRTALQFEETAPISSYLFAFAAGRFSVETSERHGRQFRMLHRETDPARISRNRDAIFELHGAALAWLEQYTGIPYPFGKFDFLLVPSFQFGGMEHPGAVFYNAPALLLDPAATMNQELGRASLIAHETAHMWFGDLVTMRWFDDVWMKEVFANFMAAKIVNPSFPGIDHDLRFLLTHYPSAYDVDRTAGTNAIRQPLQNLLEAGSLYGAIIYQKAPIVMRQLEMFLGPDGLRDGLREYLRTHAFANASWPDLIALLDRRTDEDLAGWSQAWVSEAGRPRITTELRLEDGRIVELAFRQQDPVPGRNLVWNQRLEVAIGWADGVRSLGVRMDAPRVTLPEAAGLPAPLYVLPTGGGIGYGHFQLDDRTVDHLLAKLRAIEAPLTRGAAWVTLWEEMLEGRIRPASLLALALDGLPRETNELNVLRMLSYVRQAYWKFTEGPERRRLAPTLEAVLRQGLEAAETQSLKAGWFGALRDVAATPETVQWLERVWAGEESVKGLTLAEPDFITLALELALRQPEKASGMLERQVARTENPDRRARLQFVVPALSPDDAVRDAFFESLADARNRRREPWVLEALSYLHHPLCAAASEQYIPRSLALLREIQRTGDIFFPKRWVDATLSGHQSAAAAAMVERFLAGLPAGYPERLRRVVLSAADDLFRARRLLQQPPS